MSQFRQEINIYSNDLMSLSKWKIAVVAALSTIGLGLSEIKPDQTTGPLILFLSGYVCVYIDYMMYRRYISIHLIARFLRTYEGEDAALAGEADYERRINEQRKSGIPFSERHLNVISTLIVVLGAPFLSFVQYGRSELAVYALPALSLTLVGIMFFIYEKQRLAFISEDQTEP